MKGQLISRAWGVGTGQIDATAAPDAAAEMVVQTTAATPSAGNEPSSGAGDSFATSTVSTSSSTSVTSASPVETRSEQITAVAEGLEGFSFALSTSLMPPAPFADVGQVQVGTAVATAGEAIRLVASAAHHDQAQLYNQTHTAFMCLVADTANCAAHSRELQEGVKAIQGLASEQFSTSTHPDRAFTSIKLDVSPNVALQHEMLREMVLQFAEQRTGGHLPAETYSLPRRKVA